MKNQIELLQINHSFGNKEVLKNISLVIEKGEVFGLLGPSGAGKTTLIKILTGQLRQVSGNAYLFGKDTLTLDSHNRERIGMVMDNSGLYERLSCYDNLLLYTRIFSLPKSRISEVLDEVKLLNAKKQPVSKLSKGMRQRLILARALLNEPTLLFLDEPTSGLDPSTSARIYSLIEKLQEKNVTIFLTTHNMEEATKLCNHIALLNDGNIVEYGKPEEICRKYNHQNQIQIQLKDGKILFVPNEPKTAELVFDYLKQGQIETLHTTEPTLENVFIQLTGRGLNSHEYS